MKKMMILFLWLPFLAKSQDKNLQVEGVSPSLYITHKVAPKENYYSVGRIYNVSPKDIAPFNKLQLESGLSLGQVIKIPLTGSNFVQGGTAAPDETLVPVYYSIKDKEGLYRVAKNHNDLPLETLKQWNNIKGDAVKVGTQLVVGYLKVKTELSSLARSGNSNPVSMPPAVKVEEVKPAPVPETKPEVVKEADKPAAKKSKKEPAVKTTSAPEVVKEKTKPVAETAPVTNAVKSSGGPGFKALYEQQQKSADAVEVHGEAGVFKSTSGWADGKYYCLHNGALPGTIIKIINTANGKFVFAKVLDNIPDIKQNEGLLIVISNAAADALGAADANFTCTINYTK